MTLPVCASCGKSSKRAKLLRCLHCVCVGCLEKHLTSLNEVDCPTCRKLTPSPGEGKSQFLALPDTYFPVVSEGGRTRVEQPQRLCDECGEDEPAESQCLDCKATLCTGHSKMHAKSRSTLNHRMAAIDRRIHSGAQVPVGVKRCIIHPSYTLESFCTKCNELMCEKCLIGGQACKKGETLHTLLSVGEAANNLRGGVQKILTGSTAGNQESVITQAIEDIETAISQLHDRTEAVSEEVAEYFTTVSKLLKVREAAILEKLDQLRLTKLLPLEQQKQRLQKSVSSHETISMLLTSCHDDCDLIRMAGWLAEGAREAGKSATNNIKPPVMSKPVFRDKNTSLLTSALAKVGDIVEEADIDPRRSRVECPSFLPLGEELVISITPMTENSHVAVIDDVFVTSLQVKVTSPDETVVSCVSRPGGSSGTITAICTPIKSGQHGVSVTCSDGNLTTTPARVMVYAQTRLQFNPSRAHPAIQLSNGKKTARNVKGGWQSVCGKDAYTSGDVNIRIRLDHVVNGHMMLFMCNSSTPLLNNFQRDNTAFGWYGQDIRPRNHRGTKLGHPWQDGDVIHLSLDCARHTLTGRHERTDTAESLFGVTGDLYLYVALYESGNQVTIL